MGKVKNAFWDEICLRAYEEEHGVPFRCCGCGEPVHNYEKHCKCATGVTFREVNGQHEYGTQWEES